MKITGELADILVESTSIFKFRHEGDSVVLRALYWLLVASLLWYEKFRKDLESIGFNFHHSYLNQHGLIVYHRHKILSCAVSHLLFDLQHTIRFHVHDILSSHVDSSVNAEFLKWLNNKYVGLKKCQRQEETSTNI